MAAVIVGVDYLFLRNRFWERLIVNIGIVLVFGAFYLKFLCIRDRKIPAKVRWHQNLDKLRPSPSGPAAATAISLSLVERTGAGN
jgi:hypothetical protein